MSFLTLFSGINSKSSTSATNADAAHQTQPPNNNTDDKSNNNKITINICNVCLDLMMKSALCHTCCSSSSASSSSSSSSSTANTNRACFLHGKTAEDPTLTSSSIIEKLNSSSSVPLKFKIFQRNARRTVYAQEELDEETDSKYPHTNNNHCDACCGILSNINHTTHALAKAITNSPFKDAYEIAMCSVVPPILCCHWDCIFALFAECCSKVTKSLHTNLVHGYLTVSTNTDTSTNAATATTTATTDGAADEKKEKEQEKKESSSSSSLLNIEGWKNHCIKEDFLHGGLRGNVVNDIRNISLDCTLPPPSMHENIKKWTYMTHGSGNGIICDIAFKNSRIIEDELNNRIHSAPVSKGLLQHEGAEATWSRLLDELGYAVFCELIKNKRNNVVVTSSTSSVPLIDIRHEPLFFYGRYRKFSRTMSQSPWFANNGQRVSKELSLQEEIANRVLHNFFPDVESMEEHNIAAAKNDVRLYTGLKNADRQKALISQTGANVSTAKLEIRQMTGSFNATATTSASAPARRSRDDDDENQNNNDEEEEEQEEIDESPAGKLGVMKHLRAQFNNVRGFSLYRFHAGGREDVDVRMLGNGRPFVIEVINPHKQIFTQKELDEMAASVGRTSNSIEVDSLAVVSRNIMFQLQEDAEGKKKAYRCVCYTQKPLPASKAKQEALFAKIKSQLPITLDQRTPIRVLHRRANLVRKRKIYEIDIEVLNRHWMIVDLLTQAGTYVKEFCHGDMNRTLPNLATLLDSPFTDIVQLDVQKLIHSDTNKKMKRNEDGCVVVEDNNDDDDDEVGSDGGD